MSTDGFSDHDDTDFISQFQAMAKNLTSENFSGYPETAVDSSEMNNTPDQPECIKKWAIEFEERIRIKDGNEQKKLSLLEEQGSKDLHNWAMQYRESLSRAIKDSRAHEKELRAEQTAAAEASSSISGADASQAVLWDRVCQLCNFVSPNPEDGSSTPPVSRHPGTKDPSKDLNRMRILLLQLKQQPPVIQRNAIHAN
ncbi:Clathrin light chain A [Clonorchis sinensis]|uniref:Clathrin light chain n=2 Tax=Clonorchis sinensis TaxID=79923 RepID=A0A8T1M5D0_CLOSI|nr:Clathrin light chain A [Clonorchis sinensis]